MAFALLAGSAIASPVSPHVGVPASSLSDALSGAGTVSVKQGEC